MNYIDENLKHTANVRRKNISIAEFIKNNSNIDFEFLNKVADTILSEKTRKVADNLINFKEAGININEIDLLSEQAKKMLVNHLETQKERIIQKNSLQPYYKIKDGETQISEKIRRDIENAARMSEDLEHTRAKLENKLLKLFTFKSLPRQEINNIINEWIDIRVLDLKSKPEYKPLYDSEFRTTMLDRFKHQVISDLGLYNDDNTRDFETFFPVDPLEEDSYTNDLANKDNLNHIMENALGYDRLLERLQSPENSASLAQANYFEQLLAEYYIDKRKEYKVSKDLLEVLNKEFNSTTYFNQTARIGGDLDLARGKHAGAPYIKDGLNQYDLLAEARRENVLMEPEDIHHLIDLGNSTNYAIDDETQGVAESLLKYTREKKDWPERLPKFDIKRTPKEWVEEKLTEVLNQLFSAREKIEKNATAQIDSLENEPLIRTMERAMSRNELKSFDKELAQHLNKETMIMRLLYELDKEYAELMQKRSQGKLKKQSELDKEVQSKKHPNEQELYNRNLKNIDAAYKLIAYRIAQKYHPEKHVAKPHSAFEYWYEHQLQRDIQQPPRPIDPLDYEKKIPQKYKIEASDYYEDYEIYKKDRLNMYQKQDVNYIIDQYQSNKHMMDNLDKKSRDFLQEYFQEGDNSQFFEEHKIK